VANEILVKDGTPVVFAWQAEFNGAASGYTRTHELDLGGLANGAARMSIYADLGATRAAGYAVRVGIEVDVAPVAGEVVDFYWSAAAVGGQFDGGATGSEGLYKAGEEAEWAAQLVYLGSLVLTADAAPVVQVATIASRFEPPTRYGCVVVINKSGQALEGDAIEMFVALIPIIDEVQA